MTRFAAPIAEQIWDMKYRFKQPDGTPIDVTVEDTWRRIARALAEAEKPELRQRCEEEFYAALEDFKFIPAGRIVAGAGTGRDVTMMNCYVMGTVDDSMPGIFDALKDAALTMQQGGGIGYDFSTLRPKGALVKGVGSDASGPLSFMDCWDGMCRTIMSAGSRRGAMMGTMRCDHPDIEDFIEVKRDAARLRNFNLSVLVTDAFMEAVKAQEMWPLTFGGRVYREVPAVELWNRIMQATYDVAEPGVIFIDRINEMNPLRSIETIAATNPCGEQPLPPYGACLLGSINLAKLVVEPFGQRRRLDRMALKNLVHTAVRMMDNVIDVTKFPLPQQAEEARNKRRIGLGVTGLADALLMLGITYGSDEAVKFVDRVMSTIAYHSALASVELAAEKGAFPLFDADEYLNSPFYRQFANEDGTSPLFDAMREYGLRNSHLTSIAPTGTISLYAGNVSSGIEPVFAYAYTRKVLQKDGTKTEEQVEDYAYAAYRDFWMSGVDAVSGLPNTPEDFCLPDHFVSAQTLSPEAHVRMQAAAQKWVDSSISKTVNCPEDISFQDFKAVYEMAYEMGCKGCTTYRPNAVTGSVLSVDAPKKEEPEVDTHERMQGGHIPLSPKGSTLNFLDKPAERPAELVGNTYKLKWPGSEHALYITINDDEHGRPFEMFINSKDTEHFAWTVALTRMISGVFRRGGDVSFVAEELKAVFDPRGGAWMDGRYIPSILAAIGGVIERHIQPRVIKVDMIEPADQAVVERIKEMIRSNMHSGGIVQANAADVTKIETAPLNKPCPKCSSYNTKNESGCFQCLDCGDSKCG